ncbi:cyclic nucleotide-binding domain-containing protein 2-like isoform X1 [Sarcophilus harrisii]|nr:cyclic nucleotide-binding domain-containing protein 2-like isoform X1 [Sarcophilus harrisii]
MQNRIKNGMLLNILSETKMNMTKESDILKSLLSICPHQRCTEDLRQIQEHLKKNSSFEHLPNEVQLQLCQIVIYQEYEAKSVIIKKGHWPMECYLVLSGKLAAISSLTAENSKSEILSEFEEGDFVGETCLLTNTHRPTTIVCKSDAELLMISKKDFDCILSDTIQEQFQGICNFLRDLPIFSSWPKEKIDFLVHCSLLRHYRAGTLVCENLDSNNLIIIRTGRCFVLAQIRESISTKSALATVKSAPTSFSKKCHSVPQITSFASLSPQSSVTSSARYGIELNSLEQGKIFGLVEKMKKPSDLHFRLISEGAECILIPTKIFLMEAPIISQEMAVELVNSYPSKGTIREHLIKKQAWNNYKAKVVTQQIKRNARIMSS